MSTSRVVPNTTYLQSVRWVSCPSSANQKEYGPVPPPRSTTMVGGGGKNRCKIPLLRLKFQLSHS